MSGIVLLVVLLGLLVLAGGVAFAVALARRGQERLAEGFEVVPGVTTPAPASWAGDHSPEARMHRRLGAAVRALRAQAGASESVDAMELRVELEQHALAVDTRLVQAAALPAGARERALAEVEVSVSAVEQAAADLATQAGSAAAASDIRALEDLRGRIRGLDDTPTEEGEAGGAAQSG